tara:strand:- start:523 stop:1263 length:741 start_codon:yes stop_codon:yes gene_type:complete
VRVVVLTTPTKHHTYFLNRLHENFEIVGIFYEGRRLQKAYPTGPFFESEEDRFEDRFFEAEHGGVAEELPNTLQKRVCEYYNLNEADAVAHISELSPEVAITYGVGLVKEATFSLPRWGTVNVHRGIIQRYRGLDSDLWAIYEEEFDQIGVTLHYVDKGLDTGAIIEQRRIQIEPSDEIYHMRYKTGVLATELMIKVLTEMKSTEGPVMGRPQFETGPYYTAMSLDQKKVAWECFQKFVRNQFKTE